MVLLRGVKGAGYLPFQYLEKGLKGEGTIHASNGRKVKVIRDGDEFTFKINITFEGVVVENIPEISSIDQECLECIQEAVAKDVEGQCRQFLDLMQNDLKTDCIDINKYALAKWRRELTPVIDQEEFIQNARIEVKVDVKLVNTGEYL
jgi:hypothetical protein